jgi:hypothetical protein
VILNTHLRSNINLMNKPIRNLWIATALLALQLSTAFAQTAAAPTIHKSTFVAHTAVIPYDQIGAVASKQYSGDGLAIVSCPDGARLRCAFQRLDASVTTEGLSLVSTKDGAKGEPFWVIAGALGRASVVPLPPTGKVEVDGQMVRFIRPELTEEYSVGIDGLQQDFVIEQRPQGNGAIRLELKVEGAKAEPMADGVRLVLDDAGRNLVYNRFKVEDARGKLLTAKLEVMSVNRLVISLDDSSAEYPVRIDPTFSDANWISFGEYPGVNYYVDALAVSGTNLFVGGDFTSAGGAPANYVAEWNGSSWSALGSGFDGEVDALAVSGTNLFAGGAYEVAEWNGSSWTVLGSGDPYLFINALAVLGTNLYAGGEITTVNGVSATGIAEWNGSSWSALGSGVTTGDEDGSVAALAVSGTNLFVGGTFNAAGGVSANCVAEWNGSSWSALGPGVGYSVKALAVSGTNLFAGGTFTTAGGISANYIAEWDGSSWSALESGMNDYVYALAVSGTNLFAGGTFTTAGGISANYIAEWNGSSWLAPGSGMNGEVDALAVSGGTLYAGGGYFSTAGGVPAYNIAECNTENSNSWSSLGSGFGGQIYALAMSGNDLIAGGVFNAVGGVTANYVAEWNGSSWLALGSGMSGDVYSLAVSGTNLFAGGTFTTAGGVSAKYVAEWNGSSWSALGSGMNDYVYALAVSGTNLFAGGYFTTAGGVVATNIAEWNGNSWSALGSGMSGNYPYPPEVYVLVVSGTNLYAGGYFGAAGGVSANDVAEWNGSSWFALESGMNGEVDALAVSGTNLFAGGYFTTAGGVPANYVAQWNGSSWSALGSGMNYNVYALAVSGSNLFAGGGFNTSLGGALNYIAEWNGSTWSALGSGVNSSVEALVVSGNNLLVGGDFTIAGTNLSAYLAEANLAATVASGSLQVLITPSAAITAGAQWQVDGGISQDNGVTLSNLSVGNHVVSFTPISGWNTPTEKTVTITNNATTVVTGVYTPIPPNLNGITLSGTNAVFKATNGQSGATYYVLMSTNLTLPLSQWAHIATNVLSASGSFTITVTNAVNLSVPERFYILQMQ